MKQKPIVTYIKNGVEETVILNPFNKTKTLKRIYKEYCSGNDVYYQINNDIEFVHFKNFYFRNVRRITTPHDTMCILENCTFEKIGWHFYEFTFEGGNFELIEPILVGGNIQIYLSELESFAIDCPKKAKEDCELLIIALEEDAIKSINIKDNNSIDSIYISAKNISLNSQLNLEKLELCGENISIGNLDAATSIKIPRSALAKMESSNEIKLTNCTFLTKSNIETLPELRIETPKLITQNVSFYNLVDAGPKIRINDNEYIIRQNKDEDSTIEKIFITTNLISILKGYKQKITEQEIKQQKEIYMQDDYKQYQLRENEIKQQLEELEAQKKALNVQMYDLRNNLARKDKAIVKSLSKKPINQLTK